MSVSGLLTLSVAVWLLAGCAPRVATSFWRIGTPADSTREGYAVLYEGKKMRHCYPISEWHDTLPSLQGEELCSIERPVDGRRTSIGGRLDTYHELHHHGVAVESELMAYRIYFDKKQTIDPYCKRTPQLELAQSHWYPNDSLLAAGYGDDVLRVSGTVGVGSVKYWQTLQTGETANLQTGQNAQTGKLCHFDKVASRSQRIVKQTKNSATIEVAVKGLVLPVEITGSRDHEITKESSPIDLSVQYTMQAGHRDMRCDVSLSEAVEGLCTGVQTIPAKGGWPTDTIVLPDGTIGLGNNSQLSIINCQLPNGVLLASFGRDWPVNDSAKYAKETVGLAVFIPKQYAGSLVHDKSNNLCLLKLAPQTNGHRPSNPQTSEAANNHCHFYLTCCGATKENHPVARTAEEWLAYLRRWAKNLR